MGDRDRDSDGDAPCSWVWMMSSVELVDRYCSDARDVYASSSVRVLCIRFESGCGLMSSEYAVPLKFGVFQGDSPVDSNITTTSR
jgi:hypothetical protein